MDAFVKDAALKSGRPEEEVSREAKELVAAAFAARAERAGTKKAGGK